MKKYSILAFIAAATIGAHADIPLQYYSTLQGKSGESLKTAIFQLVGQDPAIKMLSYGSGNNKTWWGFYVTDRNAENNEVIDRYSNDIRYFGNRGAAVSGMNIEHSFPKSWWGGASNNAYKDLYNLMPCEQKINSSKSNYAMGSVLNVTTTNGCTKIGTSASGMRLWEPADKWKGDFARGYMYMATAYQNFTWQGDAAPNILQQGAWPTLKQWAYELYIKWAKTDDVDAMEVDRNEAVSAIQGNRNPYIDFPNLMEYVWGDSINIPFNVNTTRKSGKISGIVIDPSDTPVEVYACTFLGNEGDCTVENTYLQSGITDVWSNDPQYGWVAKGSRGASTNLTRYQTDASLLTPEIDLTDYAVAYFTFDHACKWAEINKPEEQLSVSVRTSDGVDTPLTISNWPSGSNWTFVNSGRTDINRFTGGKIRLVFRYTSTEQEATTWEIKNLAVTAMGRHSGLNEVPEYLQPELDNTLQPVEYYTTDGRRIDPSTYRGIVIRRQGTSVTKLLLR